MSGLPVEAPGTSRTRGADETAQAGPRVNPAVAGWTLLVLFLANFLSVADRALLGVVTEPVRLELALSDTQMSLVNGFLFVTFNLLGGVVIARFVDRRNRKWILVAGVAAWSAATASTAWVDSFFTLSLARIAVGVGEATAFPVALSMLADLYSPSKRAGAVGVFQSSNFAGIVGGTIAAGVLAAMLGWRDMFLVCGAVGVVVVVLLVFTVREPVRENASVGTPEPLGNFIEDLIVGSRRILSHPGFVPLAVGFGISGSLGATLGAWGPAFLQRAHDVPLAEVGLVIGPPVGLGGIAGMLFSGFLANWLVKRSGREMDMLLIPLFALPLSLPFIVGFVFSPSLVATMASAAGMNFLLSCTTVPCVTLALGLVAPTDRGLASTLLLVFIGLLGAALGPFVVGLVSDLVSTEGDALGLRYGLSFLVIVPFVAALALLRARNATRAAELPA